MPAKLNPGTPSIGEGVRIPCQWIELGSDSRLVTASATVSPSLQRRIGAGIWPLMPLPVTGRPVTLTGMAPISSRNSVPLSNGARDGAANALRNGEGASVRALVAAAARSRRRRVKTGPVIARLLTAQ